MCFPTYDKPSCIYNTILLTCYDHPGSLKNWPDWVSKFLKLAEIEASYRPALKKLLQSLTRTEEVQRADGE